MISVLYVDDEPMLLDICRMFLHRSGNMQVTTSTSALEGLKLLTSGSFDAIISDYQMPGMDGIEFLKAVRRDNITIPFIIFTGRGREEIVIEALKEGADLYLQKGGEPQSQFAELKNNIEQLVRQRKAESDLIYSETLYHTLFEAAQDAIFVMDGDRIIECNHRTAEMLAADIEYFVGKSPVDLSPEFQDDGTSSRDKAGFLIHEALEGRAQFFEWKMKRTDGTFIDVEVSLNRIEVKGTYLLLSIIRDISERKRILNELERKTEDLGASYEEILATEEELRQQYLAISQSEKALRHSEEKLRSTLASMDDLVLTLDPDGVFLDAYKEKAGQYFIPPEQFIGHHYREILPPALADLLGSAMNTVITGGKTEQISYDMNVSGEIRSYSAKMSIRLDDENNISGFTIVARDITDEQKAQKELTESKTKLEAVIQGNPIPQFVIDKDHIVTHWNEALAEYSGIPSSSVIGTKTHWMAFYLNERPCLADLLVDEQVEKIAEWYKGTYSRSDLVKDAFEAVDYFPRMGKSGKWLYFTAAPIRNEDGEIIGAVETLEDITKQKEAYQKLEKEEIILNAVIHESPVPAFVIDKDHKLLFWNLALSMDSGIPSPDVIGSTQQWRAFYPEERPCLADLLVDNAPDQIEKWYAGKYSPSKLIPGAYEAIDFFPSLGMHGKWLYFTAAPIRNEDGEIMGAVEILEDISDQKKAQEELHSVMQYLESVIQNALVWLMVLDKDTNIVIWNEAAEEISGYTADEVIGTKWIWESLYPDALYRKKITNEIIHIISEDSHFSNLKTQIHAKNGSLHTITWNTRALRNEIGEITGYVAVGIENLCSAEIP